MGMKIDLETGVLTINEKYQIKPLMPLEEIRNSNLIELMDERSKNKLINDPFSPIFVKCIVNGQEVSRVRYFR